MAYSKKTINVSKLDKYAEYLRRENKEFIILIASKIKGRGTNDVIGHSETCKEYNIRKLEYKDFVVLETIIQTNDSELDDFIISKTFELDKIPKRWKTVITK